MSSRAKRSDRAPPKPSFRVLFIAGFGPIVADPNGGHRFYGEDLGISLNEVGPGYFATDELEGAKHFALWPLSQAAESCFGTDRWPEELPRPQGWIEFDVDDIARATSELKARGYRVLVSARKEPWGQTVSRLLGPEGLLVGVTHTPWLRPPNA
jgi:glyoxalase/bleomycin resistance protein/dioxygenase superfamily protein